MTVRRDTTIRITTSAGTVALVPAGNAEGEHGHPGPPMVRVRLEGFLADVDREGVKVEFEDLWVAVQEYRDALERSEVGEP